MNKDKENNQENQSKYTNDDKRRRLIKTINAMQPDPANAREKRRKKINHQHGFIGVCNNILNSLSFTDIFVGGGAIIVLVCLGLAGYSHHATNPQPTSSTHHTNTIHYNDNVPKYHYSHVSVSKALAHYHMAIKLSPSQVAFFNQFYYTDRSRRNYTKIKDVYYARLSRCHSLVNKYSKLYSNAVAKRDNAKNKIKKHVHVKFNQSKYLKYAKLADKYHFKIEFYKAYAKEITKHICHQYPHFKQMYKNTVGNSTAHKYSVAIKPHYYNKLHVFNGNESSNMNNHTGYKSVSRKPASHSSVTTPNSSNVASQSQNNGQTAPTGNTNQ